MRHQSPHNLPPRLSRYTRTRSAAQPATRLDLDLMRRALDLARTASDEGEAPIGCIVYETATGRILGEGRNARERDADPTAHAEVIAIRAAAKELGDWRLNNCTLIVTLEPCIMCAGAIINARLGRVIHAADDPKAGATRSLYRLLEDPRLNHRITPIHGILAADSSALLKAFFKARRG